MLVAIGDAGDGYREIIGAAEDLKEDLESWKNFFIWLSKMYGKQLTVSLSPSFIADSPTSLR